jgi:putative transposase
MSNVHRLKNSEKIFFITTNLNPGEQSFLEPEYQIIAETLANERQRLGFLLFGYVSMPDHIHALIWTPFSVKISEVLQNVKRVSAFKINRLRRTSGSRWQRQFWDRFVRHGEEFRERMEYMHLNPVRKGIVQKPEHWRWSSYNDFSLDKSVVMACPLQIDYVHLPDNYRA